jgi:polysaccharide biosynthesis protein PslH
MPCVASENSQETLRILVILQEPLTRETGAAIPYYHYMKAFAREGAVVDVLYVQQDGDDPNLEDVPEFCDRLMPVRVPRFTSWAGRARLLSNTVHLENFRAKRTASPTFFNAPELRRRVRELARTGEYDVVFVSTMLAWCGREFEDAVRVIMAMDGWTASFRDFRDHSKGFERLLWSIQVARMKRMEARLYPDYHLVVTNSEADTALIKEQNPGLNTLALPNGVDAEFFTPPGDVDREGTVVFVGDMSYPPNVHAVREFHARVWPIVTSKAPNACFKIVGRNPAPSVKAIAESDTTVRVTGGVPDVRPHLWNATAMAAPMVSGGGTKNKVLEGLAAGLPVVTTRLGARGFEEENVPGLFIREVDAGMAEALLSLLTDASHARQASEAAHHAAFTRLSWTPRFECLRDRVLKFVETRP